MNVLKESFIKPIHSKIYMKIVLIETPGKIFSFDTESTLFRDVVFKDKY